MVARSGNGKILGIALLVTLGLVWWVGQAEDGEEVILSARSTTGSPRPVSSTSGAVSPRNAPMAAASGLPWELLQARTAHSGQSMADLFKSHAWYVPPPRRAEALPPPRPAAPPVPFSYVGKLEDGPNGTMLMLVAANKLHTVAIGDVLDGQWRLDAESAESLRLTYLPLGLSQTLQKSSKAAGVQPNNPSNIQHQGTKS